MAELCSVLEMVFHRSLKIGKSELQVWFTSLLVALNAAHLLFTVRSFQCVFPEVLSCISCLLQEDHISCWFL